MTAPALPQTYSFTRQGRSKHAILVVVALLVLACILALWFDAALWIVALPILAALPIAYDIGANRRYGVEIDDTTLRWWRAGVENSIALNKIEKVQLRTRYDLSVSARVTAEGQLVRIGPEVLGPSAPLFAQFSARDIPVTRQHFTFMA